MSFWSDHYDRLLTAKNEQELDRIYNIAYDEIKKNSSAVEDEEGMLRYDDFYINLKHAFKSESVQ